MKGATYDYGDALLKKAISIRAPNEGSDQMKNIGYIQTGYFNPRSQ